MYDLYFYLALAVPYTLMFFVITLWLLDVREARRTKRESELDRAFDRAQANHDAQCNDGDCAHLSRGRREPDPDQAVWDMLDEIPAKSDALDHSYHPTSQSDANSF